MKLVHLDVYAVVGFMYNGFMYKRIASPSIQTGEIAYSQDPGDNMRFICTVYSGTGLQAVLLPFTHGDRCVAFKILGRRR